MSDGANVNWLRGALTDKNGLWDIANIGLAVVTASVLGTIIFMGIMTLVDWVRCNPVVSRDGQAVLVACRFDPESIGRAVGFVCGGYATALVALASYMFGTRERPTSQRERDGHAD